MEKGNPIICPTCKHKSVEYTFLFTKGLSIFLWRLLLAGGPAKTDKLGLTYSQRTNSQKLRYWGLAKPHINEESARKAGWWEITEKGKEFALDKITINCKAVMRNNEFVRYEGRQIGFYETAYLYMDREHYREQIRMQILAEGEEPDLFKN